CELVEIFPGTQDEHDHVYMLADASCRAEEILQDLGRCSLFPKACFTKNSTFKTQEMQEASQLLMSGPAAVNCLCTASNTTGGIGTEIADQVCHLFRLQQATDGSFGDHDLLHNL